MNPLDLDHRPSLLPEPARDIVARLEDLEIEVWLQGDRLLEGSISHGPDPDPQRGAGLPASSRPIPSLVLLRAWWRPWPAR